MVRHFFITLVVVGFIIRNIDLLHFSCRELLKPLEFSKFWEHKGVFCYANEVTFGKHLGDLLVKGCLLGNQAELEGWNFLPPPDFQGEEKGGRLNESPITNHLVSPADVPELPENQKECVLGWWTRTHPQAGPQSPQGQKLLCLGPSTMYLFIWLFIHVL